MQLLKILRYMDKPKKSNLKAVIKILSYVKGTKKFGMNMKLRMRLNCLDFWLVIGSIDKMI